MPDLPYNEIDNILKHRVTKGHYEYLVKFKQQPLWEAVWLRATALTLAPEVLTASQGYNTVLVVVEKLTKYVILLPTRKDATAVEIARLFNSSVMPFSAVPEVILSDRDAKFTSQFWTALFHALNSKLAMSSAYHPQTDGQT